MDDRTSWLKLLPLHIQGGQTASHLSFFKHVNLHIFPKFLPQIIGCWSATNSSSNNRYGGKKKKRNRIFSYQLRMFSFWKAVNQQPTLPKPVIDNLVKPGEGEAWDSCREDRKNSKSGQTLPPDNSSSTLLLFIFPPARCPKPLSSLRRPQVARTRSFVPNAREEGRLGLSSTHFK